MVQYKQTCDHRYVNKGPLQQLVPTKIMTQYEGNTSRLQCRHTRTEDGQTFLQLTLGQTDNRPKNVWPDGGLDEQLFSRTDIAPNE